MDEFRTLVIVNGIEEPSAVERRLITEVYGGDVTPYRYCRDQKMTRKAFDDVEANALATFKTLLAANQVCGVRDVL